MTDFVRWLSTTSVSGFIQDVFWVIPTIQTIHILAVSVVVGSVLAFNLRLLGMSGGSQTLNQAMNRFALWFSGGLVVLAISGAFLIVGEPKRELENVFLWTKLLLIGLMVLVTIRALATIRRNAHQSDDSAAFFRYGRAYAIFSFVVLCAIMVAGRWIAYSTMPDGTSG